MPVMLCAVGCCRGWTRLDVERKEAAVRSLTSTYGIQRPITFLLLTLLDPLGPQLLAADSRSVYCLSHVSSIGESF